MKETKKMQFISIIIPCRNEEKFIDFCIKSIIANDYPKEKLEILIVDGMSIDKTRKIIKNYIQNYPFIKLLDNQKKITPCALNIGIKNAKGKIIIRMDAHSSYEKKYISKCAKYLKKYDVDNVGGISKAISAKNTIIAKAIVISLGHVFGAGGSYFRIGFKKPRLVDTVFGGCYKKEVFDKIGLFNENLIRSQDMEFNLRLKRSGGKILLIPDIISYYYPKSNLKDFFLHNFEDGVWTTYSLKFVEMPLCLRHYIPLFFVSGLLGTGLLGIFFPFLFWLFLFTFGVYLLIAIYFSAKITLIKKEDVKFLFLMATIFACRHIGYGLGSIWGLIKLLKNGYKKTKRN